MLETVEVTIPPGSDTSNNVFVGLVCANNGKASATGALAAFARTPAPNQNYLIDVQIDLWHANQKTYDDSNLGTTDTPPTGWVAANTVITGP